VWTLVFCLLLLSLVNGWSEVVRAARSPRILGLLSLGTLFISTNWGVFIWAVTNDETLQASLGYFINPIVSVLLGVVLLRERLRGKQWAAVGLDTVAMLVLVGAFGGFPLGALTLAISFGLYGLIQKLANVGAIPSLAVESALATPLALGFLVFLWSTGTLSFGQGLEYTAVLIGAGVITAVPLLLFGAAAIRIPLSTLGTLQYIGPTSQFILALTVFDQEMTVARWVGFVMVWLALVVFT
jgi:chloramphenicol-sensitive protein RarD